MTNFSSQELHLHVQRLVLQLSSRISSLNQLIAKERSEHQQQLQQQQQQHSDALAAAAASSANALAIQERQLKQSAAAAVAELADTLHAQVWTPHPPTSCCGSITL
jgi:hypothetical protein